MTDYRDRDRDRDNRPSWSELDKRKNRSHHVGDERPAGKAEKKPKTGYGQYKEQLDQLFKTGQQSKLIKSVLKRGGQAAESLKLDEAPERQKLLRSLRDAVAEREVQALIDEFTAAYGELPDDIEILTQALMHSDDRLKAGALGRISRFLDGHVPPNRALLLERVKTLALWSEDYEVLELARVVKKKLGA